MTNCPDCGHNPDHAGPMPPDQGGGVPDHRRTHHAVPGVLDVISVVSNSMRYRSRYDLFRAHERHLQCSGVRHTVVELALGDRPFEVTQAGNPRHVQLRSREELWHKENLINIGISRLPMDWRYVSWVDADLTFLNPSWAQDTIHALQRWDIVQPFSHSINMGPTYHPLFDSHRKGVKEQKKVVASWTYCDFNEIPKDGVKRKFLKGDGFGQDYTITDETGHVWHSGFAWAARREAIDTIGGLLDWAILGSADRHMADFLIGFDDWNPKLSDGYRASLDIHKARFDLLKGNHGFTDGLVAHHFHGRLVNRMYMDRWKILFKWGFDPTADIKRDWQGLWQLSGNKPGLRDDIRRYFMARQEDDTTVA